MYSQAVVMVFVKHQSCTQGQTRVTEKVICPNPWGRRVLVPQTERECVLTAPPLFTLRRAFTLRWKGPRPNVSYVSVGNTNKGS